MMSEYENPTITFYPHESEFDVTPEEQSLRFRPMSV